MIITTPKFIIIINIIINNINTFNNNHAIHNINKNKSSMIVLELNVEKFHVNNN